ncbi:diacylglycerol kinase [Epilithonimonas sp.]|uniref:diacylglycerol kinase n=1 Tax=Epilithonimonas sp. TaxID=2894511 RepID=UPI0028A0A5F5|nr:diacylglycerol kinase [Epilithonimonas sp.]
MKKPPFYKSVQFTIKGLIWILRNERNFQIEVFGLMINLFLIVFFGLNPFETCMILITSFVVLITESVNTCIEKICDYIQSEFDQRIGIIKDLSGGAVLLSVIVSIGVGALIYWPYLKLFFY